MRLNDLPDKQTVLVDEAGIRQPAFEIGVAFRNERGTDLLTGSSRQSELLEFINAPGLRNYRFPRPSLMSSVGMLMTHSFASSKHLEAVVCVPDVAAYERGLEFHDHVPAHGHDVGRAPPFGTHQHNRAGLNAQSPRRKLSARASFHLRLFGLARVRQLASPPFENHRRVKTPKQEAQAHGEGD